uniref:Uncharacterized protein n=1 Tax=Anguilla anguilla TaxID=7936 RepID=A0A0E9VQL0_ANGAN
MNCQHTTSIVALLNDLTIHSFQND